LYQLSERHEIIQRFKLCYIINITIRYSFNNAGKIIFLSHEN